MLNITNVQGHVFVAVPSTEVNVASTVVGPDGKPVDLFQHQGNFLDGKKPQEKKRIFGEVIGAPRNPPNKNSYEWPYKGYPRPITYRGHDTIMRSIKALIGPKESERKKHSAQVEEIKKKYRQSSKTTTYEPKFIRYSQQEQLIRKGDTICFHFNVLQTENWMGYDAKHRMHLYKIPYEHVFFIVRGPKKAVIPVNAHVLVEPYWGEFDEEIEVGGKKVKAKLQKVGNLELVVELTEKPKYLRGTVRYIGKGLGPNSRPEVRPGHLVIYLPKSEFIHQVNGKDYYVMQHEDIIGVQPDGPESVVPAGDYVLIKPDQYQNEKHQLYQQGQEVEEGKILLRDTDLPKPNTGRVQDIGPLAIDQSIHDQVDCGDRVQFEINSHFYVPLQHDPEGRLLVRYNDIYCKLN